MKKDIFVLNFEELTNKDVPLVGGKNASLGEMIGKLSKKGVRVPGGFAVTASAYRYFLKESDIAPFIKKTLDGIDVRNLIELARKGKLVRDKILKAPIPKDLEKAIVGAYKNLEKKYGRNFGVAVRSSATAEDLPSASFAGQQETYLNIKGNKELLLAYRKCLASLFTDRAIAYRAEMGFSHLKVALSVGVQKMVRSDLASAGVMFSCDTESGFGDAVLINGSYGLGENVVKGTVTPDQFYVFETTLKKGFRPILGKSLGSKEKKLIYSKGKNSTKEIPVPLKERREFVLSDNEILKLAKWSIIIEDHYGRSMDMEWAKDGNTGDLFIVQARPETVQSRKKVQTLEEYKLIPSKGKKPKVIISGLSVGSKIGQGKVNVIKSVKDITKFKKGEVLVTEMTDPDWVPAMKLASAIVTDYGGRTAHAAIVSRELGIPCVVGSGRATKDLKDKKEVTVSCAEGETGYVYEGIVPFRVKRTDLKGWEDPKTKIMMNLAEPGQAFTASFIPSSGVGLAREEFIVATDVGIHPMALVEFKKLKKDSKNKKLVKVIEEKTSGWSDKSMFFVDKLAFGIGKIAAAFYPKEVIVRLSDFKTNEYRSLIGGEFYEPREENPMIGWRGASRYYHPDFVPAFKLECKAIKKVREEMGLDNLTTMVPFCRTVEEGKKVVSLMEKNGLGRKRKGKIKPLKIYVMCEIPSNVILADKFLDVFDGMSIGSNDLTQLAVGVDRDSGELLRDIANEKDEAVKKLISQVIAVCKKRKKYIGICGQGPSDFPDFATFLVKEGIESISLNPDTVLKTTLKIIEYEKKIGRRK